MIVLKCLYFIFIFENFHWAKVPGWQLLDGIVPSLRLLWLSIMCLCLVPLDLDPAPCRTAPALDQALDIADARLPASHRVGAMVASVRKQKALSGEVT